MIKVDDYGLKLDKLKFFLDRHKDSSYRNSGFSKESLIKTSVLNPAIGNIILPEIITSIG